ncbi:sugar/nucleoside kinase (ribokinase family) [Arthrobacter ulcerisalmonis]|nr:PfkB family carbohydrate kinase [Arthrobacter ulcerisalmonis]MDQ0664662.1 sugar/nucleoside kinase (ribokinase family) [Arthrobacter ulcerisalmonis]
MPVDQTSFRCDPPGNEMDEDSDHHRSFSLTVITNGAEGSRFTSSAADINIPSVKTNVADIIGAGDSYVSALIMGFLTRGTEGFAPAVLEQLGRTAAAAAAITVQRAGANPPALDELKAAVEANHASV